jgi:maltooligosyltrehalose trehalohydrolase
LISPYDAPLGAVLSNDNKCRFLAWAPRAQNVDLHIVAPRERMVPMQQLDRGYFFVTLEDIAAGSLYRYRLNGETERPDPASRFQPEGVHGPSQVIDHQFNWSDRSWRGLPMCDYVLYELHVGTFTPEGTFDSIIPRIPDLKFLGITAIEIMPVAQFPGHRNWGYDGVYPFAVQNSYGGPVGLKRLVNACHQQGIAVVLDVVYNHLGPEGNYLSDFGFYFTDMYKTPWGSALNFEQAYSDEVRRYFIDNALQWVVDFHIDGLRLDAIHAIVDPSARPFVQELASACHQRAKDLNRRVQIIAESNRNDRKVVTACEQGGWGLDAEWNDDFHHSLRVTLTAEREGYYQDFSGVADLARSLQDGFVYAGRYSPFRKRRYGSSSKELPAERLVVFSQNHDQVGNRKVGDRLTTRVSFEQLKLAAAAVLLSPFVPLLFMGEEYGEPAPFQYFISHEDAALIEAVRRGRQEEFATFEWKGELPDPQDDGTFRRSKLNWDLKTAGVHLVLWTFYRELLRLRREIAALANLNKQTQHVTLFENQKTICVHRWEKKSHSIALFHFDRNPAQVELPVPGGLWDKSLSSAEERWGGPGGEVPETLQSSGALLLDLTPWSASVFTMSERTEK